MTTSIPCGPAGGPDASRPHATASLETMVQDWAHETFAENLVISGITGSVAAELSNTTSNLDAWVVLDDVGYPIDRPAIRERHRHSGLTIKALLIRKSEWSRLVRRIAQIDLSVRSRDSVSLESVMNSKRLSGNEQFDKLITNEVKQTYMERLLAGQRDTSLSLFLDYIGALEDGEPALITELLQSIFRSELECALILRGDTYRNTKWLPKRIRRNGELATKYYTTYRDLLLRPETLGTAAWTEWMNTVWSRHHDIQRDILFGDRKMVTMRIDQVMPGVRSACRDVAKPLFILKIDDQYFCKTTDRQFELSELAACLACQPSAAAQAGELAVPTGATTVQLEKAYGSLARFGLLTIQ
ncbi:hypothetical protein KUV51_18835 [Tateyamaria omphalii]|uniref:hypothetical protein n=1 Tax=Tateyamaria omphalii TaxID=299262 RepID=UPI001C998005|nr:hypothetical protein [Tateyamaria omphalii]MBY5935068.1 hypothetical protein [Tateyamaria omphalii]